MEEDKCGLREVKTQKVYLAECVCSAVINDGCMMMISDLW